MTSWTVPAVVERVVDGDTMVCMLDLGWNVHWHGRIRLLAVNSPELPTPEGIAAKTFVEGLCPPGTMITFVSKQLDVYGRPLGTVQLPDGSYLAERLLDAGHAVPYP